MSNPDEKDVFAPVRASLRARLGQFMDVYMDAKIKIAQKLGDKIAGENDIDKIMEMSATLNDILVTEEGIESLDHKLGLFLDMLKKHAGTYIEIKRQIKAGITEM